MQASARSTTTQTRVPRWQLMRRLQYGSIPQIYVPTRLLTGEYAHYCTVATLREEPLPGSMQPGYQIKDQGMLILTSRRMLYIGRKRQLVLSYNHLLHISHLQGAIAVASETWSRREIFEMRLPLECTMYLDAILLRFRQQTVHLEQPGVSARSTDTRINAHHAQTTVAQASQQLHKN